MFTQGAFALTGKAAVVIGQRNFTTRQRIANSSKLLVVYVNNNVVTRTDTILRGDIFRSKWSFDGRRIAFYRNGFGVSIIDADGQNLRSVAPMVNWPDVRYEQAIAWPGIDSGKWVYYHHSDNCPTCTYGGNGQIWRVNVNDTSRKELLCDLKRKDFDQIRDNGLSISCDAKYAAMEMWGSPEELGYPNVSHLIAFNFPPQVEPGTGFVTQMTQLNASGSPFSGGCNVAMSASGNILYNFQGAHTCIYASLWNHTSNTSKTYTIGTGGTGTCDLFKDIEPALNSPWGAGDCVTNIQGAGNSDQVIVAINFWEYGVGVGERESNQMIVNWKAKEAVYTTHFPDTRTLPGGKANIFFFADIGDFWVDGGAANPGNKYQAADGSWVAVPGAVAAKNQLKKGPVQWSVTDAIHRNAAMYDSKGKRLGDASCMRAIAGRPGVFFVKTSAPNGTSAHRLVIGGSSPIRD
jgi:hypothetical protein